MEVLREMAANGMDVARLNMTHGDYDWHATIVERIREINRSGCAPARRSACTRPAQALARRRAACVRVTAAYRQSAEACRGDAAPQTRAHRAGRFRRRARLRMQCIPRCGQNAV